MAALRACAWAAHRHASGMAQRGLRVAVFGSNTDGQLGLEAMNACARVEDPAPAHEEELMGYTPRRRRGGDSTPRAAPWGLGDGAPEWAAARVLSPVVNTALDDMDVRRVACGAHHSVFVGESGDVWACGGNDLFQVGVPHREEVQAIHARMGELRDSGAFGALLDTSERVPVRVEGVDGVETVVCGREHNVAQRRDGSLWAWGSDAHGQCGTNADTRLARPVRRLDAHTVTHVAAGWMHTLAVVDGWQVWAWGGNLMYQLGLGHMNETVEPEALGAQPWRDVGVRSVSAGVAHSVLVDGEGGVWTWGTGKSGQLGGARPVMGVPARADQLALPDGVRATRAHCGLHHTVLELDDGSLASFGAGGDQQLGHALPAGRVVPQSSTRARPVHGWAAMAAQVAPRAHHNMVRTCDGDVFAWGFGGDGELGVGASTSVPTPARVDALHALGAVADIACGWTHTVALFRA